MSVARLISNHFLSKFVTKLIKLSWSVIPVCLIFTGNGASCCQASLRYLTSKNIKGYGVIGCPKSAFRLQQVEMGSDLCCRSLFHPGAMSPVSIRSCYNGLDEKGRDGFAAVARAMVSPALLRSCFAWCTQLRTDKTQSLWIPPSKGFAFLNGHVSVLETIFIPFLSPPALI